MKSPVSDPAKIMTTRASIIPVVGGKYFALAILFSMNLLNYVDRYSFFAAGSHIQPALAHRRLPVRLGRRLVHDRVHDRLSADGLAGGPL